MILVDAVVVVLLKMEPVDDNGSCLRLTDRLTEGQTDKRT